MKFLVILGILGVKIGYFHSFLAFRAGDLHISEQPVQKKKIVARTFQKRRSSPGYVPPDLEDALEYYPLSYDN